MNRLPVVERTYDFVKWLVGAAAQFPKGQRYLLGDRMETAALDLLDLLVDAQVYPEGRRDALRRAAARVDRLTYLLRLSHDLRFLSPQRYEYGSGVLADIGRQTAGWMRRERERAAPRADRTGVPQREVVAPA